jgi:hypothetical protein
MSRYNRNAFWKRIPLCGTERCGGEVWVPAVTDSNLGGTQNFMRDLPTPLRFRDRILGANPSRSGRTDCCVAAMLLDQTTGPPLTDSVVAHHVVHRQLP